MLLPKVNPLIGYLAKDEECEIGFRREDPRIDAREGGSDFGSRINIFLAWNSFVTGNLAKSYGKGGG